MSYTVQTKRLSENDSCWADTVDGRAQHATERAAIREAENLADGSARFEYRVVSPGGNVVWASNEPF